MVHACDTRIHSSTVSLQAEHGSTEANSNKGAESSLVEGDNASGIAFITTFVVTTLGVTALLSLLTVVVRSVSAVGGVALRFDHNDLDILRHAAVIGARGIGVVAEVGAVVERRALVGGDDLECTNSAVGDVLGPGKVLDADGTGASDVPELRSQGDIEIGGVLAETNVEPDVGKGVVKLDLDGTTIPLINVVVLERNIGAYAND